MGCPAEVTIGDTLVWTVNTHDPATAAAADADSVPTYRVYEEETPTPILTGSMAKLDDGNTTGYYSESIACTTGNGFEAAKSYSIYVEVTINSVVSTNSYNFKAKAATVDPWAVALPGSYAEGTAGKMLADDYAQLIGIVSSIAIQVDRTVNPVDLIAYGDMETDLGWPDFGTPDTNERSSADKHGGTYSRHAVDTDGEGGFQQINITWTQGLYYTIRFWYKIVSGTMTFGLMDNGGTGYYKIFTGPVGSWMYGVFSFRSIQTGGSGKVYFRNSSAVAPAEFYVDDVTAKAFNPSGLLIADIANLDVPISTVAGYLDTEVASILADVVDIKSQTDKLTFTSGDDLDVNVQKVNDVALVGDGSATPWGPA